MLGSNEKTNFRRKFPIWVLANLFVLVFVSLAGEMLPSPLKEIILWLCWFLGAELIGAVAWISDNLHSAADTSMVIIIIPLVVFTVLFSVYLGPVPGAIFLAHSLLSFFLTYFVHAEMRRHR
jgi:hypothetical protein